MKLEKIKFNDTAADRVYSNYLKRVGHAVKTLSTDEKQDVLMEFNSHIYEGLQRKTVSTEMDCLLDVIDKLGDPEDVLKPLVAEKKMDQAVKSFNPKHVFKALALNIGNGVSYVIFAILYMLLFGFVFLIFAKLFNPDQVGLFYLNEQFQVLGYADVANGSKEVLGHFFIPVMLVSTVVSYLFITLFLKLKRKLNKR